MNTIPDALIEAIADLLQKEEGEGRRHTAFSLATTFFMSFRINEDDDEAQTYYKEGRDAAWFEKLNDEDFAYRLMRASHDLADANIEAVECWIPIQAIVSLAADRMRKLIDAAATANGQPTPARCAVNTATETELRELFEWPDDEEFPSSFDVCDGKWVRNGERYDFESADEQPDPGLLMIAQAFVDRKYTMEADARQKSMGLAYVTAERTDLAREIAAFTEAQQNKRIAELEAALVERDKRINALRSAVRAEGFA
ncbi:MAG: hypothetical protein QHD01_05985 [Bradyrhizobium sp.]|uniref:hypothetical protein n=1 Tax=Bradyrhizobium sp. TaxID=376 RepID=UPI0029BC0AF2|nr:hypothetical protein [Bradyrhizobium sp.]MDX3966135.1 hypothetical protein [Bradyrhizobium sp.]